MAANCCCVRPSSCGSSSALYRRRPNGRAPDILPGAQSSVYLKNPRRARRRPGELSATAIFSSITPGSSSWLQAKSFRERKSLDSSNVFRDAVAGSEIAIVNHWKIHFGRAGDFRKEGDVAPRCRRWVGFLNYFRCLERGGSSAADIGPSRAIRRPTVDLSKPVLLRNYPNVHQLEKLKFWVITVNTADELLAAATLRSQLFYSYPDFSASSGAAEGLEGIKARLSHELSVRDLITKRIKSEFDRDSKMQLLNMKVKCLLAVCEESNRQELPLSSPRETNSVFAPPAMASPGLSSKRLVAVGTLDIQDGTGTDATVDINTVTFQLQSLANAERKKSANRGQISTPGPGHSLLRVASSHKSAEKHGYIFNLCVTETARRQGVATALMREAALVGQQMKLQILYVHVEANNNSALALYQRLDYTIEEEESADVETRFHRPRRILLSRNIL